jgi:hypothetical protein
MILRCLSSRPLKVVLNTFQDRIAVAFAKMFNCPLFRVAIAFAEVTRLASWNNIRGDVSRIGFIEFISGTRWYVVFLMQHGIAIKQSGRIAAVSTDTVPIVERAIPVLFGKSAGERSSPRSPKCLIVPATFGMTLSPLPVSFVHQCARLRAMTLRYSSRFIGFGQATIALIFAFVFAMIFSPISRCLSRSFEVCVSVSSCYFTCVFWISRITLSAIFAFALAANRHQAIQTFGGNTETYLVRRVILATFRAAFEREGDIEHNNLLKLSPDAEVGAESGNSVVRRVIKPSLALPKYTRNGPVTQ